MQRPGFTAVPTVVGSFPHTDARLLTDRILARFAEMPAWPQMPARDWRESMYVQYSEGLPGAVVDRGTGASTSSAATRCTPRSSRSTRR